MARLAHVVAPDAEGLRAAPLDLATDEALQAYMAKRREEIGEGGVIGSPVSPQFATSAANASVFETCG